MSRATRTIPRSTNAYDIKVKPGHYIRRLQQIANAIFMEETKSFGITPVQLAVIMTLLASPDIDQRTLASAIDFDAATVGGVIDRLEKRKLLQRYASPEDRRAKLLSLTREGVKLSDELLPLILKIQKRLLAPLSAKDQTTFAKMLKQLVEFHSS